MITFKYDYDNVEYESEQGSGRSIFHFNGFRKSQIMLDMKLCKNVFWNLRNKFLVFPMIEYNIFEIRENGRYFKMVRDEPCSD